MIDKRSLIIEYVSSSETLKTHLSEQNCSVNWKEVCLGIVWATYSLHLRGIIHNDINCITILIRKREYVKLIDFRKCTIAEDLLSYSIKPGSDKQKFYNKYHCHLAYELRHVPGSQVCFKADIYSVGYFFRRISNRCILDALIYICKQILSEYPNKRPEVSQVLSHLMN